MNPNHHPLGRWAIAAGTFLAAAALAGCGGGGDSPSPQSPEQASAASLCASFLGRTIEGAVITRALLEPATDHVPEQCVVRGEMPQDLDFEVRLPTSWNKRTIFLGGGGFDGSISTESASHSPDIWSRGYATIGTNHGHNSPGADFALNPQMLEDYAYLAVPKVLAAAKAILQERYGNDFTGTKMVYESCSGGGRQGLIQAQRYPNLFDGVISRAPANAYTPQFLWYQKVQRQLAQPGAALSSAKYQALDNATRAKCDASDGLVDGIISNPAACSFDPAELACTGAETDSCLTPPQVQSARTLYAPTSVANGRYQWPGFMPGGEATGWLSASQEGLRISLGSGYMQYMVAQNPTVNWLEVDPSAYTSRIDQLVSMIDAVDPDLSRFKARGGKLLLWTGQADWLITANNATAYYQSVVQSAGGQAAADEFVEYYTSPGVQHCAGGTGADKIDLAGPMFEWLEKGTKPSASPIVATKGTLIGFAWDYDAPPALSRPLCRYPQYPRYVGGDPNAAASFVCTSPD